MIIKDKNYYQAESDYQYELEHGKDNHKEEIVIKINDSFACPPYDLKEITLENCYNFLKRKNKEVYNV